MNRLTGRVAVVTGASHGIGAAVAEALAREDCALALVDVDEAGLRGVAERLKGIAAKVSCHRVDVSQRGEMQELPEKVLDAHGAVHILVNNAGVAVSKTLEEHSFEDLDWIIGTNLWGVVHGCKVPLPYLLEAEEGHIVTVSSMLANVSTTRYRSYCATKAVIRAFTESLAAELTPTQVGVSCIFPGTVRTRIVAASRVADERRRPRTQRRMDRYGTAPEKVARRVIRAIQRNELRVMVGLESRVIDWFRRLSPSGTGRLIGRGHRKRVERRRRRDLPTRVDQQPGGARRDRP